MDVLNPSELSALHLNPDQQRKAKIIEEVAHNLKYVYLDKDAFYEANAAIYLEYYRDEIALLHYLLFPKKSPLYQSDRFKKCKATEGFKWH